MIHRPPRHCASQGILRNVEATLEPYATSFLVLGHLRNAIGRPMRCLVSSNLGHRIASFLDDDGDDARVVQRTSRDVKHKLTHHKE